MRARGWFVAVSTALACAAPPARAAVPRSFFGMQVDGPVTDGTLDLGAQLRAIRTAGAGTVRFSIDWAAAQPVRDWSQVPPEDAARYTDVGGVPTDFSAADRMFAATAAAGLRPLPVVLAAPFWARADPGQRWSEPTPAGRHAYARFLAALVARYPAARQWQVWNEPNGGSFWTQQPGVPAYAKLLQVAYPAVKAADPRAQVVCAGMFGYGWLAYRDLYRHGARRSFDIAAVHPFTLKVADVVHFLQRTRRVMARNGDARKPLMVSELSWPAAKGRTSADFGFDTTPAGQAKRLRRAYGALARLRGRLRIPAVFWSTWATGYRSQSAPFDYAGLFRLDGDRLVAQPSFHAYVGTVKGLSHG